MSESTAVLSEFSKEARALRLFSRAGTKKTGVRAPRNAGRLQNRAWNSESAARKRMDELTYLPPLSKE
jgi:hypothetical protein